MNDEKIMIDEAKTQAAAEVSEDVIEQKTELSEEELMDFYLENQDAIDLMGGLEMFESLMALDEEQFTILKPQLILQRRVKSFNSLQFRKTILLKH